MGDSRPTDRDDAERLNPDDVALEDKSTQLTGSQAEGDQVFFRRSDEVDRMGELTDTEIYQGELEAGVNDDLPTEPDAENIESLTAIEMRAGETGDANVAAEEGLTYVPPIDPPVVPAPDDPEGARVAAGFGTSALAEEYDADHASDALPASDEMEALVRDALRADSATSRYADSLVIATRDDVVAVRGTVDEVDDTDTVAEVIGRVDGVAEVRDELEVRALSD